MLKEISRDFDSSARAIRVVVEDDFGNRIPLMFHVANLTCFTCGRTVPTNGDGTVDVGAAVQAASAEHDIELEKIVTAFANNGADVSAISSALAARKNSAATTPTPPASGVTPSGIPSSKG